MRTRLGILPLLVASASLAAAEEPWYGSPPGAAELAAAGTWFAAHWGGQRPPPLAFVYRGLGSADFIGQWNRQQTSAEIDARRTDHTLLFDEPGGPLRVRCQVTQYRDCPALEWVVFLENRGDTETPIVAGVRALDVSIPCPPGARTVLHHALGDSNSASSFLPVQDEIKGGTDLVLTPVGGRSSDGHLPFFNLVAGQSGVVAAVGWSGQWQARFARGADGAVAFSAGMEETHFVLRPGETVRSPSIVLLFWDGDDPLRGSNLFRQLLLRHYSPRRAGQLVFAPICGSVAEADPDGSYEGPHLRIMKPLAERGVEVFWSDMDPQQWYPGGFPNGTGTWEPDLAKYPRGLKPVGDAARAHGLQYLLWFEPERVAPGTRIDREHPEWVMKQDDGSRLFRLHDPAARAWLLEYIDAQITLAQLSWVRWDFNIQPLGFWRANDAEDRRGITEIRHIEGLYEFWDTLRQRHPGLVIDNCASGGRRLDLEACRRGLPLWHSDLQCSGASPTADQLQNAGLNRWIPMHGCGNFALEPAYAFRSAMTAGNILCSNLAAPETLDAARRTVALYKRVRPFMLGDFYPLFPESAAADAWFGWQFHRADLDAGFVLVFRREKCVSDWAEVTVRALSNDQRYRLDLVDAGTVELRGGREVAPLTVGVPSAPGSALLFYERVPVGP